MASVEITSGANRFEPLPSHQQVFVKTTLKSFQASKAKHTMVHTRKMLIYNRTPTDVKVYVRNSGKTVDVKFEKTMTALIQLPFETDAFVAALDDGTLKLVRAKVLPNGDANCDVTEIAKLAKPCVSGHAHLRQGTRVVPSDPRANVNVVCFSEDGSVNTVSLADGASSTVANVGSAPEVTSCGFNCGISAFSKPSGEVILRSPGFDKEVISKPWFPHQDEPVSALRIFTNHAGAPGDVSIMTAAMAGNEVRFWKLSQGAVSLTQTVTVVPEGTSEPPQRLISFDDEEDYVLLLPATGKKGLVILELSEDSSKPAQAFRVTEWNVDSDAVSFAPVFRNYASGQGAEPERQLTITLRSPDSVCRVCFDGDRLDGPSNLVGDGKAAAPAPATADDSIKKWFQAPAPGMGSPVPSGVAQTTISSNSTGTRVTRNTVDAAAVQQQLHDQAAQFAVMLNDTADAVQGLEREANENLTVLRGPSTTTQRVAEKFVEDNGSKLRAAMAGRSKAPADGTAVPCMDPTTAEAFASGVKQSAQKSVDDILPQVLKAQLATSVERHVPQIVQQAMDKDAPLPKATSLAGTKEMVEMVDRAHKQQNELMRRQKMADSAKYGALVSRTQKTADVSSDEFDQYMEDLQAAISGLKSDIAEVRTSGLSIPAAAPVVAAPSEEDLLGEALTHASGGLWDDALRTVVKGASVQLLMNFLESETPQMNRAKVAESATATFPVFLTVLQQLTHGMSENVGNISFRTSWAHEIVLLEDEKLAAPDAAMKPLLESSAVDIANVIDAIGAVEERHSGALDRTTKRQLKTMRKALKPYGL